MTTMNHRKPLVLKNRTKYFNPDSSAVSVTVSSPSSFQNKSIKIEGYETRLYWQYRYCDSVGGCTFYYTLTYNDKSIPNHYGMNCFDYFDLREFLTGGFRKILLRKYGATFKYFIGAELGEGKGKRGFKNNPHYHILFFVEPANNPDFPYKLINPYEFRNLVRLYWQGFDQDDPKFLGLCDFRTAKYGIAQEGDDVGLVYGFTACSYCAKYVCKDVRFQMKESDILYRVRSSIKFDYYNSDKSYQDFLYKFIYPLYNIPKNPRCTEWIYSEQEIFQRLLDRDYCDPRFTKNFVVMILYKYHLWSNYREMVDSYVEDESKLALNEWRNRYSNKCRISHGVGDYALEHIKDLKNPTITMPSKNGFKERPICLYYFRKLFTGVFIDKKGSVIRVLNSQGVDYKVSQLEERIKKKYDLMLSYYDTVLKYDQHHVFNELFDKMRSSDVNTSVFMMYQDFYKDINDFPFFTVNDLILRYVIYKLVYEGRFFKTDFSSDDSDNYFPELSYLDDYRKFITPSLYFVDRSDLRLDSFLQDSDKDYLPYSSHPSFYPFMRFFDVFDLFSNYFFVQTDDKKEQDDSERKRLRSFHKKRNLFNGL